MANLFHGVGDTYAKTKNLSGSALAQEIIFPLYLFDFEYTDDVSKLEAKGQIKGVRKTLASAKGESTTVLRLSTQFVNWSQLGFFLDQLPTAVTSVQIPLLKSGRVPTSSPYEVNDAAIVSGNLAGVYVYVTDDNDADYRLNAATAAAGSVAVSAGKITFHTSDAGKPFVYTVPVTRTNTERYGGQVEQAIGTIEFWGKIYGTEDIIHFPSLDFSTAPSFGFTGDVATLEVEFSANVDISSGDTQPYRIYPAA